MWLHRLTINRVQLVIYDLVIEENFISKTIEFCFGSCQRKLLCLINCAANISLKSMIFKITLSGPCYFPSTVLFSPRVTCTENFVKFGHVLYEIWEQTDVHTYRVADSSTLQPAGYEVKTLSRHISQHAVGVFFQYTTRQIYVCMFFLLVVFVFAKTIHHCNFWFLFNICLLLLGCVTYTQRKRCRLLLQR